MPYDEELARMRAQMLANQDEEPPVFDDGARYLGQDPNMMPVALFGRPKKPVAPPTSPSVNLQRRSILGLPQVLADLPAVIPSSAPKPTPQQIEQAVPQQQQPSSSAPSSAPSTSPLQSLADKALNAPMTRRDVLQRAGQAALQQVVPMPKIADVVPDVVAPLTEIAKTAPTFVPNDFIDTYLRDFIRSNAANAFDQEPAAVATTLWSIMQDSLEKKLPKSTFNKYEGLASDIKYHEARDYDSSDLSHELFTHLQSHMKDLKPHELAEVLDYLHMDNYDPRELHGMMLDYFEPELSSSSRIDKMNKELGLKPSKAKSKAKIEDTFGSKVSPLEFENYLESSWAHSQKDKESKP